MMENLKALISGRKLTNYQRALAKREFEGMLKTIEMYEKTLKNNAISPHVIKLACLCPRTKYDDCDRDEPCLECNGYRYFRQACL